MTYYVGILDGSEGLWGVRLPDVPGCVGAGETPDLAVADAATALRDVMSYKRSGGFPLQSASALADILASGEVAAGETIVLIRLALDTGRTVRANLTLDAGLLEAIDAEAAIKGITRSAFVAGAAREKIEAGR